jgi:hypothetical protein
VLALHSEAAILYSPFPFARCSPLWKLQLCVQETSKSNISFQGKNNTMVNLAWKKYHLYWIKSKEICHHCPEYERLCGPVLQLCLELSKPGVLLVASPTSTLPMLLFISTPC